MKDYLITMDGTAISVCQNILDANDVARKYRKVFPVSSIKIWEFYKEVE